MVFINLLWAILAHYTFHLKDIYWACCPFKDRQFKFHSIPRGTSRCGCLSVAWRREMRLGGARKVRSLTLAPVKSSRLPVGLLEYSISRRFITEICAIEPYVALLLCDFRLQALLLFRRTERSSKG